MALAKGLVLAGIFGIPELLQPALARRGFRRPKQAGNPARVIPMPEGIERRLYTVGAQHREYHWGDRFQVFTWVNEIDYTWTEKDQQKSRRVHVALCHETWVDAKGETHESDWAWLSGQPLTADTVVARCNRAGHHRWAIETNFLVEKWHGDHFEHTFAYDWTALKVWHYLMKLARLLNALTFWTEVGKALLATRGYQDAIRFFRETWTGRWLGPEFLRTRASGPLAP